MKSNIAGKMAQIRDAIREAVDRAMPGEPVGWASPGRKLHTGSSDRACLLAAHNLKPNGPVPATVRGSFNCLANKSPCFEELILLTRI